MPRIQNQQIHKICRSKIKHRQSGFHWVVLSVGALLRRERYECNCIIFLLSGEIVVSSDETNNHPVAEGEFVFMHTDLSWVVQATSHSEAIVLDYISPIHTCDTTSMNNVKAFIEKLDGTFFTLPIRPVLQEYLHSVRRYLQDNIQCRHLHEAKEKELSTLFMHYYTLEEIVRLFARTIRINVSFRSLVMHNYKQARSVEELARRCGYGVMNFYRLFRQTFKESPYQWMQAQASIPIRYRLHDVSIPLKAIMAEFGFSSPSHLNSYCKRHFGAPPSVIRKQLKIEP